jgi:hypothetical protein
MNQRLQQVQSINNNLCAVPVCINCLTRCMRLIVSIYYKGQNEWSYTSNPPICLNDIYRENLAFYVVRK